MVRKLALAVAIALGGVSTSALALGLGDIRSNSVLNQPLNADIELLSVGEREIEGIKVTLASAAAFERAGVNRAYYISQLRFIPERRPDGSYVVRVTTDFPIRESFLNFLIEVNWPKGRLVREYTVLLDPPTTTGRRAPQIRQAETVVPATEAQAQPVPRSATPSPAAVVSRADEYGPVRRNETLWGIATRIKPSDVTVPQMMMALLQANPGAFIDNDMNRLRRGQILRVPDSAQLDRISRAEASAMWRTHKEAWLARQGVLAAQATVAEAGPVEDLPVAQTRPVPLSGTGVPDSDGRLRIAAPRPDGEGEAGAGETENAEVRKIEELNTQLLIARENAESARIESGQLRQKVDELQAQMEDMQRLLTLKDDQLAQLQQRILKASETAESTPRDDVFDTAQKASEAAGQTSEDVAEPADELVAAPGEEITIGDEGAEQAAGPADAFSTPDEIVVGGDESDIEVASVTEAPPVAPVEPMVEPMVETAPEAVVEEAPSGSAASGLFDSVKEKLSRAGSVPIIAAAVAALVFLVSAFGFFLSRGRRKAAEAKFDQEFDGLADAFDERPDDIARAGAAGGGPDTSMLSEFAGNDAVLQDDTVDVDPVSEADVYIAYGRYQQAEQLLRKAMDKDADRLVLPHKLLEVFYATRKPAAFVGLAGEMMADGRDMKDTAAWERVKKMGRELAPDNPMFTAVAGGATVASFAAAAQAKAADAIDSDSVELDDLGLTEITPDQDIGDVDTDTHDVDFTLDLDGLTRELEQETVDGDSLALDEIETLDLELSEAIPDQNDEIIPLELPEADVAESGRPGESERLDKVDDGFDPSELQTELEELSEIVSLDLDMTEVSDLGDIESPTALQDALTNLDDELTGEGLMLDSDDQGAVFGEEEVDTKLELARAYVDMGDEEGARSILQEVQEEGSDMQKGQAQKLLQRLGT